MSIIEEPLRITTRDSKKLEAILRKPDGRGPFPAVAFVSGLGMTMHEWKNSFDEISRYLVNAGFLTLQFTFSIFHPDGSCRELPLDKRASEFTDVLVWMKKRQDVNAHHMGVLAQSFGVPTVLCSDLMMIKSLVFVSGTVNPYESITRVYSERGVTINYKGDTTLPRSSGEFTTVGKDFWKSLESFDPLSIARKITPPAVFMVHGDQDTKIPIAEAQKFFTAIGSKNKKLRIFMGGDHGITDVPRRVREEFLRDVAEWFSNTL